jgi:uncharacterized protein (TIGR03067 family)
MNALAFLALALPVSAPALKDKPSPEPTIVGTWAVESSNVNGRVIEPGSDRWVFNADGTQSIYGQGQLLQSATYSFGPRAAARTLDLVADAGGRHTNRCLYRIDGDTMTLSVGHGQFGRPADLDPGKGVTVWVFKRVRD